MSVIKRDRGSSAKDLLNAIDKFVPLLEDQQEDDAVVALKKAATILGQAPSGSEQQKEAVSIIVDAFEGEHELNAYILTNVNPESWTAAEQLSVAATRVLSLTRRLR